METSYTTTEIAARLGCSRSTVRNLIKAGKLPAFRVGKNWRVQRETLLKFMNPKQRLDPTRSRITALTGVDEMEAAWQKHLEGPSR